LDQHAYELGQLLVELGEHHLTQDWSRIGFGLHTVSGIIKSKFVAGRYDESLLYYELERERVDQWGEIIGALITEQTKFREAYNLLEYLTVKHASIRRNVRNRESKHATISRILDEHFTDVRRVSRHYRCVVGNIKIYAKVNPKRYGRLIPLNLATHEAQPTAGDGVRIAAELRNILAHEPLSLTWIDIEPRDALGTRRVTRLATRLVLYAIQMLAAKEAFGEHCIIGNCEDEEDHQFVSVTDLLLRADCGWRRSIEST